MTNEDITATDYTRNNNNEPVQPQLEPAVLNVMNEIVKIMAQQVAVMDSIPPPLENTPQNEPVQIITQPDLQDIITKDDPDLNDLVKIKDKITDVINETPNNLPPTAEEIGLVFPERTGIQSVDDKNYDDFLDTLQQIRPDVFTSDDDRSDINDKTDFTPFVDGDGNVVIKTESDVDEEIDDYIDSDTIISPHTPPYIDSDTELVTTQSDPDTETIPYIGDSDTETIPYTKPKFNRSRKDEIYRIRAKKKALKTLAKKRAIKLQNIKKKRDNKTTFLYRLTFQ